VKSSPALPHALPESHPHVKGIATLRGNSLSVIDLSRAIGERPLEDPDGGCLIVTDVSRSKQGLHVQAVSKIVHCLTTDIRPPPFGSGNKSFITGVTQVDGTLVQVLDIEKVIHGIAPARILETEPTELSPEEIEVLTKARILVVDDSQVALQQSVITLRNLGLECHTARSAREAIDCCWTCKARRSRSTLSCRTSKCPKWMATLSHARCAKPLTFRSFTCCCTPRWTAR
jgi:two-component system chemotaxis response regulator CheV